MAYPLFTAFSIRLNRRSLFYHVEAHFAASVGRKPPHFTCSCRITKFILTSIFMAPVPVHLDGARLICLLRGRDGKAREKAERGVQYLQEFAEVTVKCAIAELACLQQFLSHDHRQAPTFRCCFSNRWSILEGGLDGSAYLGKSLSMQVGSLDRHSAGCMTDRS